MSSHLLAICEYGRPIDHETALSAVRNLNNVDVGGRPLRIDLADSDPFLEGKTTVRGELMDEGFLGPFEPRSQWRLQGGQSNDPDAFLSNIPPGIQVPPGLSSLDSISQTLASIAPNRSMEVLAQMKVRIYLYLQKGVLLTIWLGFCHMPPRPGANFARQTSADSICALPSTLIEQNS